MTIGSLSGLRKVIADTVFVNTVCWMGSTTITVSALTDWLVETGSLEVGRESDNASGRSVGSAVRLSVGSSEDRSAVEVEARIASVVEAIDEVLAYLAKLHGVSESSLTASPCTHSCLLLFLGTGPAITEKEHAASSRILEKMAILKITLILRNE